MINQKCGNMKFAYRNREFWCKGYYVDTVGKNTATIKEYIASQFLQIFLYISIFISELIVKQ